MINIMNMLNMLIIKVIKESCFDPSINFIYSNKKTHSLKIDNSLYKDINYINNLISEYLISEVDKLYKKRNDYIDKILNND